ncbi:MAG: hypothetical protein JO022_03690, partial [Acidobacteriaceae bacterium]|nr:hypothetical protein [Acidobacteriaceae bacterium]
MTLPRIVAIALACALAAFPQSTKSKALAGGTLIDGYGGPPLRHSVILISGERIT